MGTTIDPNFAGEVFGRLNAARGTRFVYSLAWDPKLATLAQARADEFAASGHLDGYDARLATVYPRGYGAELTSSGHPTAAEVVAAWVADPALQVKIYAHWSGGAVAVAAGADGAVYCVADFATHY